MEKVKFSSEKFHVENRWILVGIPLNGKYRLGTNPCKGELPDVMYKMISDELFLVCTCTATGFICEDQCETVSPSTSTSTGMKITHLQLGISISFLVRNWS